MANQKKSLQRITDFTLFAGGIVVLAIGARYVLVALCNTTWEGTDISWHVVALFAMFFLIAGAIWIFISTDDAGLRQHNAARFQLRHPPMSHAAFIQACDAPRRENALAIRAVLSAMTGLAREHIHPSEQLMSLWSLLPPDATDQPTGKLLRELARAGLAPPSYFELARVKTVRELAGLGFTRLAIGFPVGHSASAQMRGSSHSGSNST